MPNSMGLKFPQLSKPPIIRSTLMYKLCLTRRWRKRGLVWVWTSGTSISWKIQTIVPLKRSPPAQNSVPSTGSSRRYKHPRWVANKYKIANPNLPCSGPSSMKKYKLEKIGEAKGKEKEIKLDIPINVE